MSTRTYGNMVIGQSGGATAVVNASLVGAFKAAEADTHVEGIYGMRHGIEGLLQEDLIDLRRQPADLWPRLLHTPSAVLGSTHYHLTDEDLERATTLLRHYHIRYVLYIGGNGSAKTVHRLVQTAQARNYELYAISIPKTIDNDLPCTDHCPGYGSAARFLALITMHSTMNMLAVPGEYPVKVIETAGRNAGWLVAATALGKREEDDPPHLLLVPENSFNEDAFLASVEAVYRRLGHVVIVAAEALQGEKEQPLGSTESDKTNSTAQYLGKIMKKHLQAQARFDKPGDLQWSSISHVDRVEAYLVGQKGAQALLNNENDSMVTLIRKPAPIYHCHTGLVKLTEVLQKQRLLPDAYLNNAKTMITRTFSDYALPLLGDPLPVYPKLEPIKVTRSHVSRLFPHE